MFNKRNLHKFEKVEGKRIRVISSYISSKVNVGDEFDVVDENFYYYRVKNKNTKVKTFTRLPVHGCEIIN